MIKLVHSADLPTPTLEEPWAQVEWLFDQQEALARTQSAAQNFRNAKKHFLDFLNDQGSHARLREPYWVDREFNEYILLRFKQYVDDLDLSSGHTNTLLSSTRKALLTAINNRWIQQTHFVDFVLSPSSRETDARAPYSSAETASILSALRKEINFVRKVLGGYRKTGLGNAPQSSPDEKGGDRYPWGWWRDEHNMRWYFEQRLDCKPITGADPVARRQHKKFLTVATNHYGGLHNLYRRWGVTAWIGPELILPYLYKLVAETGLNPTVAMALRLDAYEEAHPLTKRPYIRYWKERGSGENELHVDVLDTGVLPLDDQQSTEIGRIWEEVASLTALFREQLPDASRERLFVYQSRGVKNVGEARDFLMDNKTTGGWAREFVERHQLKDDRGQPLRLTLARFRPSLVSRMVKRGVDIHIIKSILGHGSVLTTLKYLDSYDFAPHARKEVEKALERIRANRREQEEAPKPVATEDFTQGGVVFATGLALCKNVFSPPANIRKAAGIKVGAPCSVFNMCLRCPNVLIMDEHLPQLFALRRQYLTALEQGLSGTTHRAAVQQNIHVLNNLLELDKSDWPQDVLTEAERRSEFLDPVVDPVAVRGVAG